MNTIQRLLTISALAMGVAACRWRAMPNQSQFRPDLGGPHPHP